MLKRLALIVGSLVTLGFLRNKVRQQKAEQDLWTQATDTVPPAAPTTPTTPQS